MRKLCDNYPPTDICGWYVSLPYLVLVDVENWAQCKSFNVNLFPHQDMRNNVLRAAGVTKQQEAQYGPVDLLTFVVREMGTAGVAVSQAFLVLLGPSQHPPNLHLGPCYNTEVAVLGEVGLVICRTTHGSDAT